LPRARRAPGIPLSKRRMSPPDGGLSFREARAFPPEPSAPVPSEELRLSAVGFLSVRPERSENRLDSTFREGNDQIAESGVFVFIQKCQVDALLYDRGKRA
jgi:hypothetical protein